uniref:Uncharacterized protein n=1 Tax=Opuntia streptacantha TaxID=393608 RepID=A0A7C8ZIG0_OPUST
MMIMSTCSPNSINSAPSYNRLLSCSNSNSCSSEERFYERRSLLMAAGIFALSFIPSTSASAQGCSESSEQYLCSTKSTGFHQRHAGAFHGWKELLHFRIPAHFTKFLSDSLHYGCHC